MWLPDLTEKCVELMSLKDLTEKCVELMSLKDLTESSFAKEQMSVKDFKSVKICLKRAGAQHDQVVIGRK